MLALDVFVFAEGLHAEGSCVEVLPAVESFSKGLLVEVILADLRLAEAILGEVLLVQNPTSCSALLLQPYQLHLTHSSILL